MDEAQDRAHTRRLAALVRESPDLVGVLTADGTVEYLSPAFVLLFTGSDPTELLAGDIEGFAHPHDVEPLAHCFATALERPDVAIALRMRCRHRDGGWHLLEGTFTNALADPDIRGVVLRASDVTDRTAMEAALRASERHHRRVVEALSEGIMLVDGDGAIVACNGAAERMLGIPADAFLDQRVMRDDVAVLSADGTRHVMEDRPVVRTLRTGEPCRDMYVSMRALDGTLRSFSVNTQVVEVDGDGAPSLVVASFTDVTDEIATQHELEQRLAIEHALADISREFLDALGDLDGAVSRALARIGALAGASHAIVAALTAGRFDTSRSQEWIAPGARPLLAAIDGWRPSIVTVSSDAANRAVVLDDVLELEGIADSMRGWLRDAGARTMVLVPMVRDDTVTGCVSLLFPEPAVGTPALAAAVEHFGAIVVAAQARATAEEARERADARLAGFLAGSWDVIIVVDTETRLMYATPRIHALIGRTVAELLGVAMIDLMHPDDVERTADALASTLAHEGDGTALEVRVRHADGRWIDVELVATSRVDDPAVEGIVVNVRDVSDRKAVEATLREAQSRFEEVFEHAPIGMALADADGRFFRVNPALCSMLLATEGELIGCTFGELSHPDDVARNAGLHRDMFAGKRSQYTLEKRFLRADRSYVWCRVHVSVVCDAHGVPRYSVGQINDITEQRTAAEILEYEARYDALTGLATRKLFLEQLERAIARTRRRGGLVAVLFIDLDHFKSVNDTMGHAAGDELLTAVARRMRAVLRVNDFACRFGGDEFMVLCTDLESAADVAEVAERLRDAIEHPFQIRGTDVFIGASIGIALADEAADASTLLSQADSAAYRAKERGRNRYEVFDDELRSTILARLETESALRRALDHDELRLLYQPVVNTRTGAVDGFEALLRWARPGHGLVSPSAFLAVAEERGLIVPIGRRIIEAACRQIVAWEGLGADGRTPAVAVNLSARQLAHPDFVEHVAEALARTGADPQALCFELTETAVMDDAVTAIATLHRLRTMGVDLAIDDFGTGYSSLSYLRRLPASVVKIDRSFVLELGGSRQGSTIVASVIHLAHALGMRIIAEGVETIEHVAALVTLGCDQMQGFYFAPPLSTEAATDYLRNHRPHRLPDRTAP